LPCCDEQNQNRIRGERQMLFIKDLKKNFGIHEILKNVNLSMQEGECLAVTGPNGCGKSTLIKCILGETGIDSGELYLNKETHIGYLRQNDLTFDGKVKWFLMKEFNDVQKILMRLEASTTSEFDYVLLMDEYISRNGFELEQMLLRELGEFDFDEGILEMDFSTLSPGQKKIMEIISIMIAEPDLFIMDEPTNHLDISMRVFLEHFINRNKIKGVSFLVVSHDRTFLDRISDKTVYIRRGLSEQITGGYSDMLDFMETNFQSRKKESERIQNKIRNLERLVQKKTKWSSKVEKQKYAKNRSDRKQPNRIDKGYIGAKASKLAKTAKATAVRQDRLMEELREKRPFVEKPVRLSVQIKDVENRLFMDAAHIAFGYVPERQLLDDVTFQIGTRDKIAIIGSNGCGKTTLFRLLNGEVDPDAGNIYRNERVNYAYLPQNVSAFFQKNILIENFDDLNTEHYLIHSALKSSRLKEETLNQDISSLSKGELMKAALVKILLSGVEFILMDEPTNNLDIETIEVLQGIIEQYPGGMMFISHDRRFVSQNADKIYRLSDGKLSICGI